MGHHGQCPLVPQRRADCLVHRGSHVQGGWIGHEMQRFLAAWTPHAEVSRGMHLPHRLAHQHPNAFPDGNERPLDSAAMHTSFGQSACAAAPIATGILAYPEDSTFIQHVSYRPDSTRNAYTAVEIWTNATRSQWHWKGNATLISCSPVRQRWLAPGVGCTRGHVGGVFHCATSISHLVCRNERAANHFKGSHHLP